MRTRLRNAIWPLVTVLASLCGLLAVSALVPDVGCQKRTPDMLETFTRTRVVLPEQAQIGQEVLVTGTLERASFPGAALPPLGSNEKYAEPFPQQRIVIESPFFSLETVTDEKGRFSCNLTPVVPGRYLVTARYPGDSLAYYVESRDSREVQFVGEIASTAPPDFSWVRYAILGLLILIGGVFIYRYARQFARKKQERSGFAKRGRWEELKSAVPWALAAVVLGLVLYALVPRGDPSVVRRNIDNSRVVTSIRVSAPSRVDENEEFTVKGRLSYLQDSAGWNLKDARVDIFVVVANGQYDVQEIATTLTTDEEGRFSTQTAIAHAGLYEVSAVFRDTGETYLESSDVRDVRVGGTGEVFGDWKSPGFLTVILGLPLAVLMAIGGILYLRRRASTRPPRPDQPSQPAALPPTLPPPVPVRLAVDSPLKIALPQISATFPDVWGSGEDLLVVFTLEGAVYPLAEATLEIELEPGAKSETSFGEGATASRDHIYARTGSYEIKAALSGKARNGHIPASRLVRIVDYREEVVRLYEETVSRLRERGIALQPKMTAREVAARLTRAMPDLPHSVPSEIVTAFEGADYSLHPVARAEYERMYLACRKVEDAGPRRIPNL